VRLYRPFLQIDYPGWVTTTRASVAKGSIRVAKEQHNKKYPNREELMRPTRTTSTGRESFEHRVIDHQNDLYRKTITDATTGEIIYFCEEPLTAHTRRGTARKR